MWEPSCVPPRNLLHDVAAISATLSVLAALVTWESSCSTSMFNITMRAAIVCCLLAAGVIFGYGALKPVLKSEGAYRQRCAIPNGLPKDEEICIEMHLNFMFTIAVVATNVAALPVGAILDHYGPRVCGLLGSLLLAFGAVLMAFESRLPIDGLMLGYLLLALGGPFTFMSSFQLSNAFPRHSGLILALLTAAFDASSAVFLIFHFAYRATEGAFTRRTFFLVYLIVPAVIALLQLTLMPARSYKTAGELVGEADDALFDEFASKIYDDEETPLLHAQQRQHCAYLIEGMENVLGAEAYADRVTRETSVNNASGVWGSLHTLSASEQLKSPWFVLICFFTAVQMTRINFFISTIRPQYDYLLGSPDAAEALSNFFDVALPLGGILAIPITGYVLDRIHNPNILVILTGGATIIGCLGFVPRSPVAAYAHVALFVLFRPFFYAAVQDLCAKVFGFRTFGRVYGAIICLSGLFSLSQGGWDYMFERLYGGDPSPLNFFFMMVTMSLGSLLTGYAWKEARWWSDGWWGRWWEEGPSRIRERRLRGGW
ncbi:967c146d-b306-4efe-8dbe-2347e593ce2e [Thermothielavioides terrestris]|uniref:967c146d-b306-4efe-8dbe-2347e593ce2e n=1 Tax=Thermothielavioides terrestris TaxID=2587410 RepID=A0A3S4AIQ7_9PEZI|nr:967c146d-b306-4efe-8dbe-2347e593ce2e [Thermothielavioides terrestris]